MASGSNKISARVYPWHDLAWDLALADGMDPAQIESRFPKQPFTNVSEALNAAKVVHEGRIRAIEGQKLKQKQKQELINEEKHRHLGVMSQIIKDDENQWKASQSIQEAINTAISTHLWRDILEGKVLVRKANGNPLRGESKQFKSRGPDTPHLTVAEGNEWLTKNRYLQVWAPGDLKNPNVVPVQRAVAQDAAILCEIKKQGYDPLALPKNQPGKNGVKRAVRDALEGDPLFIGTTVFDKAWERLSHDSAIVLQ